MAKVSPILSPSEQVAYLRDEKGVTFDVVGEQNAAEYLASSSYFYKTKAYAKAFEKYRSGGSAKGRYINLDFGHLVELERLDGVLRSLVVLRLALDIEHAIKARINAAAMRSGTYSSSGSMKGVRRKLAQRGIDGQWVADVASVPLAMELSGILMAYDALVAPEGARRAAAEMLAKASSKFADDAPMFSKTYSVAVFVKFASEIFDAFSGRLACNRPASNLSPC